MANKTELIIVRGNTPRIPIEVFLPVYRYSFTVPAASVYPVVGSRYRFNEIFLVVTAVNGQLISAVSDTPTDVLTATGSLIKTSGTGDTSLPYTVKQSTKLADITGMTFNVRVIRSILDNPGAADIIIPTKAIVSHDEATWGQTHLELTAADTTSLPLGSYIGVLEAVNSSGEKAEQNNNQTFPVTIQENKIV